MGSSGGMQQPAPGQGLTQGSPLSWQAQVCPHHLGAREDLFLVS